MADRAGAMPPAGNAAGGLPASLRGWCDARWACGQGLIIVAVLGCFTIEIGAVWLAATVLLATASSLLLPAALIRLPSGLRRLVPFLLLGIVASDFLMGAGDVLPPLYRMLLWLILYRSLQARTPREDLQLLLLTLFLVITTGVLSHDLSFALQLLAYAPIALLVMLLTHLSTAGESSATTARRVPHLAAWQWRNSLLAVAHVLDRRLLVTGFTVYVLLTAFALLLFISLPRFDIGQALPFPRLHSSTSLVGFSESIQYGDLVGILDDGAIAMRVDVVMADPPALPYWRMGVLDAYAQEGFRVSPDVLQRQRELRSNIFTFGEAASGRDDAPRWTVYLEGGVSAFIPVGGSFSTLRFNSRQVLQVHELSTLIRTKEIPAATLSMRFDDVRMTDRVPAVREDAALRQGSRLYMDTRGDAYLQTLRYPDTLRVVPAGATNLAILERAFAQIGFRGDSSAAEYATRIVEFLRDGRGYSLQVRIPRGEADLVLRWLDAGLDGHCELYAGAFVLLARYAGLPARIVTGFVGGDWNGFENYFMVRNRHAHAWCEVFDPDGGWLRVDPTPGFGLEGGSVDEALAAGRIASDRTFQAYLDSLRMLWFRRVIQFDSGDQQQLVNDLRGRLGDYLGRLRAVIAALPRALGGEASAGSPTGPQVATRLVWLLLLVAVGLLVFLWLRRPPSAAARERRIRRRAGRLLIAAERARAARTSQLHAAVNSRHTGTLDRLQRLRYGPVESWPADSEAALRKAEKRRGLWPRLRDR